MNEHFPKPTKELSHQRLELGTHHRNRVSDSVKECIGLSTNTKIYLILASTYYFTQFLTPLPLVINYLEANPCLLSKQQKTTLVYDNIGNSSLHRNSWYWCQCYNWSLPYIFCMQIGARLNQYDDTFPLFPAAATFT